MGGLCTKSDEIPDHVGVLQKGVGGKGGGAGGGGGGGGEGGERKGRERMIQGQSHKQDPP